MEWSTELNFGTVCSSIQRECEDENITDAFIEEEEEEGELRRHFTSHTLLPFSGLILFNNICIFCLDMCSA